MTKEITELIEYLKEEYDKSISQGNHPDYTRRFQEWATAVEQLQKNYDLANQQNLMDTATIVTYERILDKGITVNVYQGEAQGYPVPVEMSDDRGESEDKVCTCNDEKIARKCPVHEDKVEKPSKSFDEANRELEKHYEAYKATQEQQGMANRGKSENREA